MGVKTVPVLWKDTIPHEEERFTGKMVENDHGGVEELTEWVGVNPGEWISNIAKLFYDGPDPIGLTHVREGVVVRILNRPTFTAYKHKNFAFKVLEGIIKDTADAPDMEEADGLEAE
jgi:hypothetical protein